MAEKKQFEWTTTNEIGEVAVNDKKKLSISYNTLEMENEGGAEEREYVSITTQQYFKKKGASDLAWNITKNATFPLDAFSEIVEMVINYLEENE